MDRLANETFIFIMSHLEFSDKLNCILVCRHWYDILVSTNLYSHLTIGRDEKKLYDAIEAIGKTDAARLQVVDLDCTRDGSFNPDAALSLLRFLPNVKSLKWRDLRHTSDAKVAHLPSWLLKVLHRSSSSSRISDDLKCWAKLQSIDNLMGDTHNGHLPLTTCLLGSGVFDNLTNLSVKFPLKQKPDLHRNSLSVKALIDNLKNAPNLEYLTLKKVKLDVYDIEGIHNNVPKLKKLTLERVYVRDFGVANITLDQHGKLLDSQGTKMDIRAADSVESLHISFNVEVEDLEFEADDTGSETPVYTHMLQWLFYCSQKYNYLKSFKCWWQTMLI